MTRSLANALLVVAFAVDAVALGGGCRILGIVTAEPCAADTDCAAADRCVDGLCERRPPVVLHGDPRSLAPSVTSESTCDPVGETLWWNVVPPGQSAGDCVVQLANEAEPPVDIAEVELEGGSSFTVESVEPAPPVALQRGDVLVVHLSAIAPESGVDSAELVVRGRHVRRHGLLVDAQHVGAEVVLRTDRSCNVFGDVDVSYTASCAAGLMNVGTEVVTPTDADIDNLTQFGALIDGIGRPIPGARGVILTLFATPPLDEEARGTVTITTDANDVTVLLSARGVARRVSAVPREGCRDSDGFFVRCTVAEGAFPLTLRNDGRAAFVVADLTPPDAPEVADVAVTTGLPFIVDPGNDETLVLDVAPHTTGSVIVSLVDGGGNLLPLLLDTE